MKTAIIGAGFAGLAAAYHLSKKCQVTLFDRIGIGAGASGVSTGLLHPYPGEHGRLSWHADAGMEASRELLKVAEHEMGYPVANYNGIIKLGECIGARSDVEQLGPNEYLIHSGITVFVKPYLEGLWKACQKNGVVLQIAKIDQLPDFDQVILAVGSGIKNFCNLKLGFVKGQVIVSRSILKRSMTRSVIAERYIAVTEDPSVFHVGSTYERDFISEEPCLETAVKLLEPEGEVIECRAAVRVTNPAHYFPILEKINPNTWVITALGSRGLLYHAYLGKQLTQELFPG